MSRLKRFAGIAFVTLAAIPVVAAPPPAAVTIKLATQAPTGTMWDKELRELGATWTKATGGRVSLVVFPDGSQGEEATVIKKMRVGTIQASLLTAVGLSYIDKIFNVFTIPFFFETDEEELAVQKLLEPRLEQALQAKGFHLLGWGSGGWVQIFSKKSLKTLADVKASKLYVTKDDDDMVQWYARNGFHAVPLTYGDIAPQLKLPSGMIDTTPNTPYLALMTQIFRDAKYMLDTHVAPFVGAVVVTTPVWNALSAEDRARLSETARAMETRIRSQAPGQDADSITSMQKRGLQIMTPDAKGMAEFRAAGSDLASSMRGAMVPADIFDLAVNERNAVRRTKGK